MAAQRADVTGTGYRGWGTGRAPLAAGPPRRAGAQVARRPRARLEAV